MKQLMNIEENKIKKKLFTKGIVAFNEMNFYDAHEYQEDLWSDYKLSDPKFIQALIQLSVGYFHISNKNINGARGLLTKCIPKFKLFLPQQRGIDVINILTVVDKSLNNLNQINDINEFDWSIVPKLKINNE